MNKTAIRVLKICLSVFWEDYHHDDSNRNVKKATHLRHFARVSHLWYISLPLLHNYYDVKFSMRGWVAVRSPHKNTFFFCYRNSDLDLNNAGEPALLQYS